MTTSATIFITLFLVYVVSPGLLVQKYPSNIYHISIQTNKAAGLFGLSFSPTFQARGT